MPGPSTPENLSVIYEDNHLIVINKSPSDIVQGDKTGDEPLSEVVKQYLKIKYDKPGLVFLGVVHRLDRPVSGIVLFAKTSKALARMNELFRENKIKKGYWAVVKECPQPIESTIVHYMLKNEKQNKSKAWESEKSGAKRAELHYKLIGSSDRYHLLEVNPVTGRHHQIRAQLAAIGCPIKGDLKYGFDRSNRDASIHLHARTLSFEHPVQLTPMKLVAAVPDEVLWKSLESGQGH